MNDINLKTIQYQKYCKTCKYMKKHEGFTYRLLHSKYFDPNGPETMPDVLRAFQVPIHLQTVYSCLKRHHANLNLRAAVVVTNDGKLLIDKRMKETQELIEAPANGETNHELGLDDFIAKGRNMLARGDMMITASTYLSAIKIKADIEKSTKDRRLDALKAMFQGAGPGGKQDEN